MNEYRLWTPQGTYRGKVKADTPAKALLKRHREDQSSGSLSPRLTKLINDMNSQRQNQGTDIDVSKLGYDPDIDAIIWPDDETRKELGGVEDWTIEPVRESA